MRPLKGLTIAAVAIATIAVAAQRYSAGPVGKTEQTGLVIPALSAKATFGKVAYDANCAQCHGVNAAGTNKGPPFIHPIYNPGHHGDIAFWYAAHDGVKHHHWNFGDMPAQPQVKDADIEDIIAYVRELQVANGITYQEHRM